MFTVGEDVEQIVHHVHRVFTAVGHEMLKTYNHNTSLVQFFAYRESVNTIRDTAHRSALIFAT